MFLVSERMSVAWPGRRSRVLFALLSLVMPNDHETFGILTNVHWYLALLCFLVLVSDPPRSIGAHALDAAILILGGLSGPFCMLLLPVALWQCAVSRNGASYGRAAIVLLTACVQAYCLLFVGAGRSVGSLGASPMVLMKIIALIPLGAELGVHYLQFL